MGVSILSDRVGKPFSVCPAADDDSWLPIKEYISYHVEFLFTNFPLQKTIHYTLNEIHFKDELPKICSKQTFKNLLLKLTTENTFVFVLKYYKKQFHNGSVKFSNTYMTKTESEIVNPSKPKFYKGFIDHIINRRYKDQPYELLEKLHNNKGTCTREES